MDFKRLSILRLLILCVLCLGCRVAGDTDVDGLYAGAARLMTQRIDRMHLGGALPGEQVRDRALEAFLHALDPSRSVLMQKDVDAFRDRMPTPAQLTKLGDLRLAHEVYTLFLERLSDRREFVDRLLADGLETRSGEPFAWDRRQADWPADRDAWDDLWRRKITNRYIVALIARALTEEEASGNHASEMPEEIQEELSEPGDTPDELQDPAAPVVAERTPEEEVRHYYRQFYEVVKDHDEHWLLALFLSSYAQAYDPHSDFLSFRDREDFDIQMGLSLVGIGALLSREDGMARVERILPGGPAEQDGRLQPGDRIIAVGQGSEEPVDILHWPLSRSVRLIRGAAGTKVVLHVLPAADVSGSVVREIKLVRAEVRLEERAARGEVRELPASEQRRGVAVGVLRVPDFYADMRARGRQRRTARSVTRDTRAILNDFQRQEVAGVLIDLRNNGGGSFEEAVDFTGLFIPDGPVVQVLSREGVTVVPDLDPQVLFDGPLVVLVNRLSASASEIVAAALMDYGRALIVGDSKTHGKGTVQTLLSLNPYDPEMGSLKVTTASFFRISGGSTQKRGVAPHVVLPSMLDRLDIGEEFLPHAMPWSEVPPARFQTLDDLTPRVSVLEEQSRRRRGDREPFRRYAALIERLAARRKEGTLPLDYEERLAQVREERALDEYQRALTQAAEEQEERDGRTDLVLEEALEILADLVELSRNRPASHWVHPARSHQSGLHPQPGSQRSEVEGQAGTSP